MWLIATVWKQCAKPASKAARINPQQLKLVSERSNIVIRTVGGLLL
jgi:hypothetical protein